MFQPFFAEHFGRRERHEHHHGCRPSGPFSWLPRERNDPRFARFGGHHGEHPFAGRERGFGGRERGFGGRERMFDTGELQLVILDLLAQKPSYGYELIKALEDKLEGGYAPSPGVVYPTLTLIEEKGFATSTTEAGKKVFTVTDAGQAELTANRDRIHARLEQNGERFGRGRSPELMRAFGNLRGAVQAKLARGTMTPDQLKKIAEAIDTAATTIDNI
jgi:DNA-binding PadR family transcriptional regulator